ncbi:MAG: aspartate carbamoyltransferase [Oscillospiraceae bacterium]|nr:aspartate carbamoyltransferase [Oscillospiraceae bacterium]
MRHLIDFGDITRQEWDELYQQSSAIIDDPDAFVDACHGKVSANLFFEPSTRTNFSFQTAMLRLGGSVFGFADPNSSSMAKGESLKDTIKMVSAYADVIVMRTPWEGAARAASLYSNVPVINAGDGGHMHPTQTMADLTTITRLRGSVDGLSIGLCGDLKYGRTVHSLIKAMEMFSGLKFYLISPRELALPEYMRAFMKEHNMWNVEVTSLEAVIPQLDVLYMTRVQRERFVDPLEYERNKGIYILNRRKLDQARKDLLIMHPLPRVDEIDVDVDDDDRAVYFDQARYGMFARMALLLDLAHQPRENPPPVEIGTEPVCHNPNCITQTEHYLPPLVKKIGDTECCAFCDTPLE